MSEEQTNCLEPSGSVFLGRLWIFQVATDWKWETTDVKAKAVRVHRLGVESVTSFDGLKAICVVLGPYKLTWGELSQNSKD